VCPCVPSIISRHLIHVTGVVWGVRSSRSLIPGSASRLRLRRNWVCRSILAIRGLIAYSRRISCIAVTHSARSSVSGQGIGVLLGGETTSSELGVTVFGLALPEFALGGAGCVAVVGGWAEGFLFLVVADESELDEDGEDEEDSCDNGDCETGGVESTGVVKGWENSGTAVSF